MNTEALLDSLDEMVERKFPEAESISSIMTGDNKILFFDENGLPLIEITIKNVFQTVHGVQVSIEEFVYKERLKGEV